MATQNAPRDNNFVPAVLFEKDGVPGELMPGQIDETTGRILVDSASSSGTVTSVSVVTANGLAGSVATSTTTPAITLSTTITGILSGNGTAISAATTTGSGSVVLATSPTLTTPVLGVATATSINKMAITAPATSSTLAVADGKTATVSNTLTLTGTDGSLVNFGAGGTVLYGNQTITLTGDITGSGATSIATTLATVNANVGSFGSATQVATFTVNGKGLTTAAGNTTITPAVGSITGLGTGVATALGVNVGSAGALVTFNGALGTPSSGTLTNATGLPIAGLVSSTSAALGVGSIELGNASDTTLSRSGAGVLAVEGVVIPSISSTNTLTNKRITRRVTTTNAPGATPTTNTDNVDVMAFTGLNTAITSMTTNLSGTPVNRDLLEFSFTDDGTARAITWGTSFQSTTITLPTTTVISTMLRVGLEWNSTASKWDCIAVV